MCNLTGRVALVTGGTEGIGFGIAAALVQAGSQVAIAGRDLQKGLRAAERIREMGQDAVALQLDVADDRSVQRCVAGALERFSHIDILVNNAGMFQSQLGLELESDDFNHCLNVNVTGIWRMVRAIVPHFFAQRSGRIVNISSVGGRRGVDFAPAYCASKAAVINLTQSLAQSLGTYNINVNTVCPGVVATAMLTGIDAALVSRPGATRHPPMSFSLAGPCTAEDIGHAVVFFASDFSKNITGQALNVDCGYLAN